MKRMTKIGTGIAAIAIAATSLTACGDKYQEPFKDGPRFGLDQGAAEVVEMPDGFSNLATKCLIDPEGRATGVRVTVVYHGDNKYGSVSQILDPSCR